MEFSNNEIEIKVYRKHWFDLILDIVACLIFLPLGIYFLLRWFIDRIVVTNQAGYLRTGLIMRDVKRLPLRNILDVSYDQRFFGRIFGFGTVRISSTAIGGIVGYKCMPNPNEMVLTISQAIEGAASRVNVVSLPNQAPMNQPPVQAPSQTIINQYITPPPANQPPTQPTNQPPTNTNS